MKNFLITATCLCSCSLLSANTLGDAIRQVEEESAEKVLCSVQNGKMHCQVTRIELTRSLYLPDAAFSGETYQAPKNNVLLVEQGEDSPLLYSGKIFEEEDSIRFTTSKNDMLAASLNPGAEHRFICFYSLPVKEIIGGSLVFEKEIFSFGDNITYLPLPISSNSKISQSLTIPGVTDF